MLESLDWNMLFILQLTENQIDFKPPTGKQEYAGKMKLRIRVGVDP